MMRIYKGEKVGALEGEEEEEGGWVGGWVGGWRFT